MSKPVIIGLISICLFIESKAQITLSDISQKYAAYQAVWSRPIIHLVLNQDKYVPGDTVFFKAYFLNQNLTPLRDQQIIEVNLVNNKGQSTVEVKFHVNNGIANSQLIIPETLTAGIYYITAHNNVMKNFNPALIFKKKIHLVEKNAIVEKEQPFIHVAAEGGHLISDIPNKIIVHTHRAGAIIQITDSAGLERSRLTTDSKGTGSLLFTPSLNENYRVRVLNDTIYKVLPATEKEGVHIQIKSGWNENDSIIILLTSAHNTSNPNNEIFVLITSRGEIQYRAVVKNHLSDSVVVNPLDLPPGLATVSILDTNGKELASRNFYNHRDRTVVVNVQPDQRIYKPREKIKLEISVTDREGKPMGGEFSISALNGSLFENEKNNIMQDDLFGMSELKTDYIIDRNEAYWKYSLDNVLITTTEALPWSDILSDKVSTPAYLTSNVIEKKGKAYFADTDKPLPDLTQIAFYLQQSSKYVQTFTTENGTVGFTMPPFYGEDEFFYVAQLLNQDDITDIRVEWSNDSFPLPIASDTNERDTIDFYASFMERKRLIDQSFGVHRNLKAVIPGNNESTKDVWDADVTVNVEDYVLFPSLQELIKEVVPAIYYRKTKKGDIVRVHLQAPMQATTSPLYIIDGIATRNTTFFLSQKPKEIKTIRIINNREKLKATGLLGKYGVVILDTKQGNVREPLDTDHKRIRGLSALQPLNLRSQRNINSEVPDFRSTIYWNPSVSLDKNGKATVEFYNSDDVGVINFQVNGITTGGVPFSYSTDVEVDIVRQEN